MSKKSNKKISAAAISQASKAESITTKNRPKGRKTKASLVADKRKSTEYSERLPFIAGVSNLVPIGDLYPHPENEKIYGHDVDASFVNAVKRNGIYTPLLITRDNKVISGNRRLEAAKQVGITEVPVVVFDSEDELDIREAIVAANRQREKTNAQVGREFKMLLEVETERARKRMGEGVENFPQDMRGKARDLAASHLGMSGKTAEHAAAVIDKIDRLNVDCKSAEADDLTRQLNKSVNSAFNKVKVMDFRKKHGGNTPPTKAEDDVPKDEGKAAIITRLMESLAEEVEEWPMEKLRALEGAFPSMLQKFELPIIKLEEAA